MRWPAGWVGPVLIAIGSVGLLLHLLIGWFGSRALQRFEAPCLLAAIFVVAVSAILYRAFAPEQAAPNLSAQSCVNDHFGIRVSHLDVEDGRGPGIVIEGNPNLCMGDVISKGNAGPNFQVLPGQ